MGNFFSNNKQNRQKVMNNLPRLAGGTDRCFVPKPHRYSSGRESRDRNNSDYFCSTMSTRSTFTISEPTEGETTPSGDYETDTDTESTTSKSTCSSRSVDSADTSFGVSELHTIVPCDGDIWPTAPREDEERWTVAVKQLIRREPTFHVQVKPARLSRRLRVVPAGKSWTRCVREVVRRQPLKGTLEPASLNDKAKSVCLQFLYRCKKSMTSLVASAMNKLNLGGKFGKNRKNKEVKC